MTPLARRRLLWALPFLVFVLLVGLFAAGLQRDPRVLPSQRVGQPAPVFSLPRLDDPAQRFAPADLKGQVWLLNVWASWCSACAQEHAAVTELARRHGVTVVGLNQQDEPDAARDWLARLGNPYRLSVMDTDGRISIDYGVYGVPETFVIDRDGIIRYRHLGPVTPEVNRDVLLPLIRKLQS